MTETTPPSISIESPKSLRDQVIEETLKKAGQIMQSEDPQIVKAREYLKNEKSEWRSWRDDKKISEQDYELLDNAAIIEARVNTIFDALTGLLNKKGLAMRLNDLISRSTRTHEQLSLLYIDLEGFKQVNDTLGHGEGDRILSKTAEFFRQIVRGSDVVARVGGDEFVIAALESRTFNRKQPNGERRETAQERIMREIQENYAAFMQDSYQSDGSQTFPHIGARVGVSRYLPGESQEDFIARGDTDMNSKRDPNKPSRQ